MRNDWYIRRGSQIYGPLTRDQLKQASSAGKITPETLIRCGLTGDWMPARQFTGLTSAKSGRAASGNLATWIRGVPLAAKIAVGCLVGVVFLVAVVLVAFEVGRQQSLPIAKTEPKSEPADEVHLAPKSAVPPPIQLPPVAAPVDQSVRPPVFQPPQRRASPRFRFAVADRKAAGAEPAATVTASPVPATPAVVSPEMPSMPSILDERPAVIAVRPLMPRIGTPAAGSSVAKNPVPQKKVPAKDADLRTVEAAANRLATAKDAVSLYDHFAATRTLSTLQQTTFDAARAIWADRARQDLVRLGSKWVTSAEAQQAHDEAAQLFQQAGEMIKILNFQEARKALEKASRVDPNSIAADFTLGLLNSITPPQFRHPPTAARHFHVVLQRIPGYVPALNNLAIAEIRQEKYAEAVKHLREAAERAPPAPTSRRTSGGS
jgi:hypothetical protein